MALPARIRVNTTAPFPSLVSGIAPIYTAKVNGVWQVGISVDNLGAINPVVGAFPTDFLMLWDAVAKTYSKISLTTLGAVLSAIVGNRNERFVTTVPVIAGTDQIITMAIASGTPNIALPAASTRNGVPLTFKDLGQAAAHNITLTANGIDTIDGLATKTMTVNYQAVTLTPFTDGINTGWFTT